MRVLACCIVFAVATCFGAEGTTKELVRAYVRLRTGDCQPASLDAFQRALSGVKDKEVSALGSAVLGLGYGSLANYQNYYAWHKWLTTSDPTSPYTQHLTGKSVTEDCKGCEGTGTAHVTCLGCAGRGSMSSVSGTFPCPKCNGSGKMPVKCSTCRAQGQILSPSVMSRTYRAVLREAETALTRCLGDFKKYLSDDELSQLEETRLEEKLNDIKYKVALRLNQVFSSGKSLAYVVDIEPCGQGGLGSLGSGSGLVCVKDLAGTPADGEGWRGDVYLVGTFRYETLAGYTRTVKLFSASKVSAIAFLNAKGGESVADGSSPERPGSTRRGRSGSASSDDEQGSASQGTGWLTVGGYIVTCYHVVEGHKKFFVKSRNVPRMPVKLVVKDKANDVAILKPEKLDGLPAGLPLASGDMALAQKVFTLGYPQTGILGNALKYTEGTVSALSGLDDDPRFLQVSVPVQSGNSGGPLINMNGEVVGSVVSKLSAIRVFALTGDLPQNVNYGVKVAYIKPLFVSLDKTEFPVLPAKKSESEELVGKITDSVFQVIAE